MTKHETMDRFDVAPINAAIAVVAATSPSLNSWIFPLSDIQCDVLFENGVLLKTDTIHHVDW